MEPTPPVDFRGLHGVLSSRTPNIASKKEREDALRELLQKRTAKAGMQRMRRSSGPDEEHSGVSSVEERPFDDRKEGASRTMMDYRNGQAEVEVRDGGLGNVEQKPSSVQTPSRRRLKKLAEVNINESARSFGDVVEIEDDSPQPDALRKSKPGAGRDRRQVEGKESPSDIAEQLGGLSIDKGSSAEASRLVAQSNRLDHVLQVSRQQALPDDDISVSKPQKKQWTDWPEQSEQGEGRKSAYADLGKSTKPRPKAAFVDLEEQEDPHTSGKGALSKAASRSSEKASFGRNGVIGKERRQEHRAGPTFGHKMGEERQGGGPDRKREESSSLREASTSGSEHRDREAKEARARERVEALLAKDKDAMVLGKGRYCLPGRIARQLYPHQRESIEWLWSLHVKKTGGILGDDMGLGKTMQIASYLTGLFKSRLIHCVLIVAPKTLLAQWELELSEKCGMGRQVLSYHEGSPNERAWNLRHTLQQGGILLTTYGMIQHNAIPLAGLDPEIGKDGFGEMADDVVTWDYVVLDEGHQIKNEKTVKAKNLRSIPARHRVIVSGTPVQNNLQEMWSLFDFCCPGLLGDIRSFKEEYERKITTGQNRDATERQRHVGVVTSQKLRAVIAPFFLRREKKDVIKTPNTGGGPNPSSSAAAAGAASGQRQMDMSARKNDLIVWLKPTAEQKRLYVSFLQSEQVKKVFNEKRSALAALTVLKKICDHPLLLTERAASEIFRGASRAAANGPSDELSEGDAAAAAELALEIARARGIPLGDGGSAGDASCKVLFLMELLEDLTWAGHRTLVFSQSKKMLDIIQAEVVARDFRFCRIDGSIVSARERQKLVEEFQTDPDIPVFLLTSQVGGLGLTLTAADRVVIIDPAWNPSVDNQSVDRAYRIGQARDVVVYRLITAGTIEEKIYCKQVFKGGLMRAVTEHKDYKKMFNENELRALFSIPERGFEHSETMERLHKSQAGLVETTPELDQHIARLETRGIVGVSHHDLLFKEAAEDVPIVATVGADTLRATSAPARRQVVDLTGRGSRKGGLTALPTARVDLLSEAHAYLKSGGASTSTTFGSSSANPWTVPAESPERSEERKAAEAEVAARQRVDGLAQELRKAEWLFKSQAPSLPDKGEKIKQKIRRLSDQLNEARVAATKPLSPEAPAAAQAAATQPLNPEAEEARSGGSASIAAAPVTIAEAELSAETGRARHEKGLNVSSEEADSKCFRKPGGSSPSSALEERQFPAVSKPSAIGETRVLNTSPDLVNGAPGPEREALGDSGWGRVPAREGLASQAGGGLGKIPQAVDAATVPLQTADVIQSLESARFGNARTVFGGQMGAVHAANDVRGSGFATDFGSSALGRPSVQNQARTVALTGQPAGRSVGAPVEEEGGTDPERSPADAKYSSGAKPAETAASSGHKHSAAPVGKSAQDRPGDVSRLKVSEVENDVEQKTDGRFGVAFGTPARVGSVSAPQSELKLRASLRKRREERGALEDSPTGGMPSFDLGLDDLDEVADKLGSLSVVS